MSTTELNHETAVNIDIIDNTIDVLRQQGFVAETPGFVKDGALYLCAGAAYVYCAAKAGNSDTDILVSRTLQKGKKQIVREAKKLGLDEFFVAGLITANDMQPDVQRREAMVEYLVSVNEYFSEE
jgi:hypothetical protein